MRCSRDDITVSDPGVIRALPHTTQLTYELGNP